MRERNNKQCGQSCAPMSSDWRDQNFTCEGSVHRFLLAGSRLITSFTSLLARQVQAPAVRFNLLIIFTTPTSFVGLTNWIRSVLPPSVNDAHLCQ